MKMEETECSETSAYKLQTPGNYPKESIQHKEYGESLKSRISIIIFYGKEYYSADGNVFSNNAWIPW